MHADLVDPGPSVTLNPSRLCKAAKAENVGRDDGGTRGGGGRGLGLGGTEKGRDGVERAGKKER